MKIPQEIAEQVITGTIQELWEVFINLEGEYEGFEEDYEKVRGGINIKFDIYDIWDSEKTIVRLDKIRKVLIYGKIYKMSDYRSEKEARRKIMVKAILENVDKPDKLKARVI